MTHFSSKITNFKFFERFLVYFSKMYETKPTYLFRLYNIRTALAFNSSHRGLTIGLVGGWFKLMARTLFWFVDGAYFVLIRYDKRGNFKRYCDEFKCDRLNKTSKINTLHTHQLGPTATEYVLSYFLVSHLLWLGY